jgi:hypothetical protein
VKDRPRPWIPAGEAKIDAQLEGSNMKRFIILPILAVAFIASPVVAGQATIGTNFGLSWLVPAGPGDTQTILAWPGAVGGLQPGLRLGYMLDQPQHEFFLDSGLLINDVEQRFDMTGNYQYNLRPDEGWNPYMTAGLGLLVNSIEIGAVDVNATSFLIGAGIGSRWKVADDGGAVRIEFRFDKVTQGKDGDVVVTDEGVVYTLKFGFDLWL